jgi:hypothetical protein
VAGHPRDWEDFDLDDGNESELATHGISGTEALQVLDSDPEWVPNKKSRAGTWLAVGYTYGGRALTLPVTYNESLKKVRPITGWDCTTGERTKYL